jgi:hypothetical protein
LLSLGTICSGALATAFCVVHCAGSSASGCAMYTSASGCTTARNTIHSSVIAACTNVLLMPLSKCPLHTNPTDHLNLKINNKSDNLIN